MKKLLAVALAAIMLFSFAACGGSGDSEAKDVVKVIDIQLTQEEYAFGVDKTQPELLEDVNAAIASLKEDGTFDAICNNYFGDGTPVAVTSGTEDPAKADEQLLVATNAAFEPFEYTQGDKYYGIDMEMAAKIAEILDMELVVKNMDFDAVCLAVGQQKCDIAMAGLTVNESREEYVTFSDSYYNASQKVVVKADDTTFDACETAEDVAEILNAYTAETKIGGQTGTTGEIYCKGDADWGFDGLTATFTGYKNGSLAIQDLVNGNLDLVIIDEAPAEAIVTSINAMA